MPPVNFTPARCAVEGFSSVLQPSPLYRRSLHTVLRPSRKPQHSNRASTSFCPRAALHTSPVSLALRTTLRPTSKKPPANHDRGPVSNEPNQTDFTELNVLGNTNAPATSVDVCIYDGFALDSGLKITEGDGVILVGTEAFVWRPWMVKMDGDGGIVSGTELKSMSGNGTGGALNKKGQWEIEEEAWGVLKTVWPKPGTSQPVVFLRTATMDKQLTVWRVYTDLLIIGTGAHIRPLAPKTRAYLQELGMRVEVLDTRNAASQFNLLATERGVAEVAAALVPIGFADKLM